MNESDEIRNGPEEERLLEQLLAVEEGLLAQGSSSSDRVPEQHSDIEELSRFERARSMIQLLAQIAPADEFTKRGLDETCADSTGETAESTSIPIRVDRFEIRHTIGEGGFGVVVSAWDPNLQRPVAVKIPRLSSLFNEASRERFLREACAAASLDHPHIVPVYEAGEDGGVAFIVSALCQGPTLAEWLREQSADVPTQMAAELVAALAAAVNHAHSRSIVHRDLKPGNVLLDRLQRDSDPESSLAFVPRITDFGLAKVMEEDSDLTRSGSQLGTAAYMSPEQAAGRVQDVGPASDIYALGVILYELLVGRPPLVGESVAETLQRVPVDEPVAPRRLRPGVPRDLETICLKCLQKEPTRRYSSAAGLEQDLRRFLDGKPIEARPVRRPERMLRWCRRNPLPAALAAGVVVAVLAGLAGVTWQWRRAASALARAEENFTTAELQGQRAARNFRRAQTAVDTMLTEVGAERLLAEPQFETIRRALIEEALGFYEQFLAEDATRPESQHDMAGALYRVSNMRWWLGDAESAMSAADQAVVMLDRLMSDSPDNVAYREDAARTYYWRAYMDGIQHRFDDADTGFRRAMDLFEGLPASSRERPEILNEWCRAQTMYGYLLDQLGRTEEAESLLRRALASRERLADSQPDALNYRLGLIITSRCLADVFQNTGRLDDALELYEQALPDAEQLVERRRLPVHLEVLADTHNRIAGNYQLRERMGDAVAAYREALGVSEQLVSRHPTVPDYRRDLAIANGNLGFALVSDDQTAAADTYLQESNAILEDLVRQYPDSHDYLAVLAGNYNKLGYRYAQGGQDEAALVWFERAVPIRQRLVALFPDRVDYWRDAGAGLHNLALMSRDSGADAAEARTVILDAISYTLGALERNPADLYAREFLARHFRVLAGFHEKLGEVDAATLAYHKAITLYEKLCEEYPENGRYRQSVSAYRYRLAGLLLVRTFPACYDPVEAVTLMEEVAQADADGVFNWVRLGRAYLGAGRGEDATQALLRAQQLLDPDTHDNRICFLMAQAHALRGDVTESERWYAQAMEDFGTAWREDETLLYLRAETLVALEGLAP